MATPMPPVREMDHVAQRLRRVTIEASDRREIAASNQRYGVILDYEPMTEPEILLPVKCPICSQELLTGFRISIVTHALASGDIRLYSNCHLAGWDASDAELTQIREFLLDEADAGSLENM